MEIISEVLDLGGKPLPTAFKSSIFFFSNSYTVTTLIGLSWGTKF